MANTCLRKKVHDDTVCAQVHPPALQVSHSVVMTAIDANPLLSGRITSAVVILNLLCQSRLRWSLLRLVLPRYVRQLSSPEHVQEATYTCVSAIHARQPYET